MSLRLLARPGLQASTNIVAWFAALWGLKVTDDLILLIGIAFLLGALNFAFAFFDAKAVSSEKEERKAYRAKMDEMQAILQELANPDEIPPHLQDLKRLSNQELRNLVANHTAQLRQFAHDIGEGEYGAPVWETVPNYKELGREYQKSAWRNAAKDRAVEFTRRENRYLSEMRPASLALKDEITRRLIRRPPREEVSNAIENGSLAGPRPIEESATFLETIARGLP